MPLLDLQGVADQAIRRGLDALNTFGEEGFYRPFRADVALADGAVLERPVIGGSFREASGWKLPGAATPSIACQERLPPRWVSGKLGMEILYTGAASSTADIGLAYALAALTVGAVIPVSGVTATFNTPGPATAGFLLKVAVPTLISVDAAAELVEWKIYRPNAPDAYGANDVWIIGVRLLWYPGRG